MPVRRVLLLVVVASLAVACLAPTALALKAGVRVEASAQTVSPQTTVTMPAKATFYDSWGNPYVTKKANALAALAAAADMHDFTWEAAYNGTFVTSIGGFSSLPDWSQGWVYTINGAGYPIIDVSAIDFALNDNDQTLWAQSPDATFARSSVALVAEAAKTAFMTGDDLTITVKADDLTQVNSQKDYDRYSLTDPSLLQTPDQFAPVEGAILHVGSAMYTTPANGIVTVAAPAAGTMRVWAEKPMDATTWYVRSAQTRVNVADELKLTDVGASPAKFRPGKQRAKVSFTLSRAANVVLQVRDSKNKIVWSKTIRAGAGDASYSWNGKGKNRRYVPRRAAFSLLVRAVDTWGRSTAWTTLNLRTL